MSPLAGFEAFAAWAAAHPLGLLGAAAAVPSLCVAAAWASGALRPRPRDEEAPPERALDAPAAESALDAPAAPQAEPALEAPAAPQAQPAPVAAPRAEPAREPPPPARLRDRLRLTREALVGRLGALLGGRAVDAALLDDLEALLLSADLGPR